MSEVFPAPEGAVMTKSLPLLKVLHLLANLLDQQLQLERAVRDRRARGLGRQRVRLAVQLLRDEVQALAGGAAGPEHALDLVEMGAQAVELLRHVGLGGEERDLGADTLVVGRADRFAQ